MAIPNVFNTGRSGMVASKAAMATTGHNIANANTEGFSRQRVHTENDVPHAAVGSHALIGTGTLISRVDRVNDEYIEKQIRNSGRELAHMEEKDLSLRQVEDIFNEMNGDGINRLMARFFNEFRQLANDPDNEAIRQSVREASQALTSDFHRLRREVEDVRRHIDNRLEGYAREVNSLTGDLKDLNQKINALEVTGAPANDLQDKRDVVLKKIASYMHVDTHKDNQGNVLVEMHGIGPLVVPPEAEKLFTESGPADNQGKIDGALDLRSEANAHGIITHAVKGGKLGALIDVRDNTISQIFNRLDELAFSISTSVNNIHAQGFTRNGDQGIAFFKPLEQQERAAEFFELSDAVKDNINNIAAAAMPDAPADNRIALAVSSLQHARFLSDGHSTVDDFYNSIVSDVGVAANKNRSGMNQQHDIMNQLTKIREQISGVSIDEETANLMQFQHMFGASAKIIQVADECLKTVLDMRR